VNNCTFNNLNLSLETVAKVHREPDLAALLANCQQKEELDAKRNKLSKAISAGEDHLARAELRANEVARLITAQTDKIKLALLAGKGLEKEEKIRIEGRIAELSEPDDDFPASPRELQDALGQLRAELSYVETQRTECLRRARRLAQQYFGQNFQDLETRYDEMVAMTRECLEYMIVQAAMAGAFFDYEDPEHRRRTGGDTRNPLMVKALKYIKYTSAMIDGNWAEGIHIKPESVLVMADTDMQRMIDGLKDWQALPVNAIRNKASTQEAMKQRVTATQANREAQGIGRD
jgi:hypothetical protein